MDTTWIENFFDKQFPLLKQYLQLDEARKILWSNIPTNLYKYRNADEYGFSVIEKGELWLARADTLNDPFDCYYDYKIEDILNHYENGFRKLIPSISNDTIKNIRRSIHNDIENKLTEIRKYFQRSIKLCSLSEKLDSKKMWEEYSDNNTGFCIELNFRKAPQYIWEMLLPVLYADEIASFSKYITKIDHNYQEINASFIRRAALTKTLKWKYEHEWRIVYPEEPDKRGVIFSGIPINCVYLGHNVSKDTTNRVKDACKLKGILVKKMKNINGFLLVDK